MKFFFLLITLSSVASAHTISVVGACEQKPLIQGELANKFPTVGDLTVHFFKKNKVPYKGSESGFNSIYNSATGDAALEVVSNSEMRAYGWCYFVDDLGPDVFADQYLLDEKSRKIEWIYAFSHYKDGVWVSNCTPAFTIKPRTFCK